MNPNESQSTSTFNEADFMRLFVKHEPALRAYARSILPDWNSIDDALQEASVTMWQKLEQLADEDGFLPWSKVILRFKCLQIAERLRRERPLLSENVLNLLADEADSVTVSQLAEMRIALNACLPKFSNAHRELLLAPYGQAGRVKQLAEEAGKSANALYKLLGRLRQKLAGCISSKIGVA